MTSTASMSEHAVKRPPAVKGVPFLGVTFRARKDVMRLLVDSYHTHGSAFTIKRFGKQAVIFAGLKANQFYMENETKLFHSGSVYSTMQQEAGTPYLFNAMDGVEHKHLRKETGPAFSRQIIADAVPGIVRNILRQGRSWPVGTTFDALQMTGSIAARQAGEAMLGYAMTDAEEAALSRFCGIFVGAGADIYPSFVVGFPGYRRAKAGFFGMMGKLVAAQRAQEEKSGCPATFLRVLMQKKRHGGVPLSDDDLIACSSFPFIMNAVYTNRVVSYLLYELIKNPSAMERVQAEVDTVVEQGDFSITTLQRMGVLRSAVKETLRLYPLIPGLPRHATADFEFEGFSIKKGEKVILAGAVTHFLSEFFPDPWTFDIDRFLPPRNEQRHPRVMTPFGMGQHACLGSNVAEIMVLATATGLLGATSFALADPKHRVSRLSNPLPGPAGLKLRIAQRPVSGDVRAEAQLKSADVALLEAGEALPENLQAKLQSAITTATVEPGTMLFIPGDKASAFYIIMKGEVATARAGMDSIVLGENDSFGEDGLLTDSPRAGAARVGKTGAELLVLDAAVFREFVGSYDLTAVEIAALARKRAIAQGLAAAMPMLSPKLIAEIAPQCDTVTIGAGEIIIREGEEATLFYIVLEGDVEVLHDLPSGQRVSVARLRPGQYFGEIGLLENRKRTATVRAGVDGTVVVALGRESFLGLMGQSKQSESAIARTVARRLVDLASAA